MSATTTHADDGRAYNLRDYIDRTIATIRQHDVNELRNNWWTGAALTLADEVDRLRASDRSLVGAQPEALSKISGSALRQRAPETREGQS